MSKINDGGPAFASAHLVGTQWHPHPGMTLRDWFAGQALVAAVGDPNTFSEYQADDDWPSNEYPRWVAEYAYQLADAMLSARSNIGEEDNG